MSSVPVQALVVPARPSVFRTFVVLEPSCSTTVARAPTVRLFWRMPIALSEAVAQGRLHEDQHVVFVAFGAGLTSAAAVVRWGHGC